MAGEEEEGELDDAADGHRSSEKHAGAHGADVAAGVDEDERGDQERVEEGRREGRRDEAAEAVERAGEQGDDRDQEQIGKGDPAQQHRQVELRGIGGKAGREREGEPDHRQLGEDGEDEQRRGEPGHRLLGEFPRRLLALALMELGEQRHEGGGEGALGEQSPEQVGDALRDEIGLRHRPGAERGGDEHVADEAEDAARRRPAPTVAKFSRT